MPLPVTSFDLLLFGGTGDLAMRKLLPALYMRHRGGDLPAQGRIFGLAREGLSRADFVARVRANFDRFVPASDLDEKSFDEFAQRLDYHKVEADTPKDFAALAKTLKESAGEVRVFFLSTAPDFFAPICKNLAAAGLVHAQSRVVLEKPLGRDLASAQKINEDVGSVFAGNADLPHRPLPGQGAGAEPAGPALRQRAAGTLVEPHLGQQCADHHRRTGRRGDARCLLRPHRRDARHGAEPPSAAAVHPGDGAAQHSSTRTRCATRSSRCSMRCGP